MIRLEKVFKDYKMGEVPLRVLRGVSLTIAKGEFVAIMGPSGSGKSTLLNIIGCLDTLGEGAYRLEGLPIETISVDELARVRNRKIGFVFQSFNLVPQVNIMRNVELPLVYSGVVPDQRRKRALESLELVVLSDRHGHTPAQLSGGQQQRVAIARALVNDPALIIADEPTGSLDSQTSMDIMAIFANLHALGKTIVMVTHEDEIASLAERVIRLQDGVIESDQSNSR